jgi:hypothetical protein
MTVQLEALVGKLDGSRAGAAEVAGVEKGNIFGFLDVLEAKFPSIDDYLIQVLDFSKDDIERVKSNLRGDF